MLPISPIITYLLMVRRRQEPCKGGSSPGWCWHDHWHGPLVCSTGAPQSATAGLPGRAVELHQSLAQELLPPLTPGHSLQVEGTQAVQRKFIGKWIIETISKCKKTGRVAEAYHHLIKPSGWCSSARIPKRQFSKCIRDQYLTGLML